MFSPIQTMFLHFPLRAYSTVFILVLISWYAFRVIRARCEAGSLGRQRGISAVLLINYMLLLLFLAVLGRRSLDYDRIRLEVLYSYRDVLLTGNRSMAFQIFANIAAFVPIGMLGSLSAKRLGFLKGLLIGCGLSLSFEVLQWLLRCGTVETDDLISNTLGSLMGCLLTEGYRLACRRWIKAKEKNDEESVLNSADQ